MDEMTSETESEIRGREDEEEDEYEDCVENCWIKHHLEVKTRPSPGQQLRKVLNLLNFVDKRTDGQMDRRTDGRTKPLIEMRGRI